MGRCNGLAIGCFEAHHRPYPALQTGLDNPVLKNQHMDRKVHRVHPLFIPPSWTKLFCFSTCMLYLMNSVTQTEMSRPLSLCKGPPTAFKGGRWNVSAWSSGLHPCKGIVGLFSASPRGVPAYGDSGEPFRSLTKLPKAGKEWKFQPLPKRKSDFHVLSQLELSLISSRRELCQCAGLP